MVNSTLLHSFEGPMVGLAFEQLDEPVSEILRKDQWVPYLMYKKAVANQVRGNSGGKRRNR